MRAGKYDKRITLRGIVPLDSEAPEDAFGGKINTASADPSDGGSTLWANLEYGSGGERRVGAAQEQANLPVTVTVRRSSVTLAIKPKSNSLYFDGKEWDIESAAPDRGRPEDVIIIARARII